MLIPYFLFSQSKYKSIEAAVNKDLVLFSKGGLPSELQKSLDSNQIIFLGETHYLQEHQEFVCNILNHISSDSIVLITESIGVNNWLVEDYIKGKISYLPNTVRFFDNYWIETIRAINKSERNIQLFFMDVNHWKSNLKSAIIEIEKSNGLIPEFQKIKNIKADSEEYDSELSELLNKFQNNTNAYKKRFGDVWYERYTRIIKNELLSSSYRKTHKENIRENFMFDFIVEQIEKNPAKKILVNCGMYHAQKETMMGTKIKRLACLINEIYPNNSYSIAFIGIKGERKFRFHDENSIQFNILNETSRKNLINIIGNKAGSQYSFLPLSDFIFSKKMKITYISLSTGKYIPVNQFDAIITIPEVNLLNSMRDYKLE